MNIWDNQAGLRELEAIRDKLRASGKRISFDCFKLKCQGDRAVCSEGRMLGFTKYSSMLLISVLRGRTNAGCRYCSGFDS